MNNPAAKPFPLIETPTSKLGHGEEQDQFHRCASEMACVHNMLLRGLNSIYLQAAHIRPENQLSFLKYSACFYELLHVHHSGEEEILFPAIEEMCGEKGIMQRNIEQHHSFHEAIQNYDAYIRACLDSSEAYDGVKLIKLIDAFGYELATHLSDEISTILSLAKHGDKMAQFEKKFEEWSNKDTAQLSVPGTLTWGFFNHDKQYENGLWKAWPPVPFPAVFLIRWIAYWVHSDWWRFASCDRYGNPKEELFATG